MKQILAITLRVATAGWALAAGTAILVLTAWRELKARIQSSEEYDDEEPF